MAVGAAAGAGLTSKVIGDMRMSPHPERGAIPAGRSPARLPKPGTPERTAIEAARKAGIAAARRAELENIKAGGVGRGNYSDAELEAIRQAAEFPKDVRWHHDPTVASRPELAGDPTVVRPVRGGVKGHLAEHGGNWRN